MRIGPVLQISAPVLWTATIITAFSGFDDEPGVFSPLDTRLWLCTLGMSLLTTMAAAQQRMAGKAARLYTEVTKAAVTRPHRAAAAGPYKTVTGPLKVVSRRPGDDHDPTVPVAVLQFPDAAHHGQRAHQTR